MNNSHVALDKYKSDFNCCQPVLAAFGPDFGLSSELGLKIGCGFAAGIGFQGLTCGAVIGGIMVIVLMHGNTSEKDELQEEVTYIVIKEFSRQFKDRYGSTRCSELLDTDVSTSSGYQKAKSKNLFDKTCPGIVATTVLILNQFNSKYKPMNSKHYFEQVAGEWDIMRETFFSPMIREKAISSIGIKSGDIVADIGSGSGFISEGLIDKAVDIIAIDQSESMLTTMKKKFSDHQNISYQLTEPEKLALNDESVDVAFANMYLHHVEYPNESIKDLFRILKNNGKLVITDLDKHGFKFLVNEHHDRWMGFEKSDLKKWFDDAGFTDIRIESLNETCRSDSKSYNEKAEISVFMASGLKQKT